MNKEWKDKWVAALRSGEYAQANGCLNDGEGMCCLGVACDVYDPIQWSPYDPLRDRHEYYGESNYPPTRVLKAFELEDHNPTVTYDRFNNAVRLGQLNDSGEFTFDQIADLIQALL
jgi:hypothetical protein